MPRKEVRIFADCMEHKLKKNDHKGGWENVSNARLFELLRKEVDELEAAMRDEPELHCVFEAADIANFAMMIAWNALRQMVAPEQGKMVVMPDYHDAKTNPGCEWPKKPCDCIPF